jgi:hypothetical protein
MRSVFFNGSLKFYKPVLGLTAGRGKRMEYPELPEEVRKELDNVATAYSFHIRTQQYATALELVTALYSKMLGWQTQYEKRLHKVVSYIL